MRLVLHTVRTVSSTLYDYYWIGMLYAGVMLPEEEDGQISAKSKDSRADFMPSLCLNVLSWSSHWKWHPGWVIPLIDFSYATRLHRDSITFVWICIYNLYIIPLRYRQPALMGGFWIILGILEPTVIFVTSTHECLIRPLLSTVHPASLLLCTWEDSKVAETPIFWLKPFIHSKNMLWAFCMCCCQSNI